MRGVQPRERECNQALVDWIGKWKLMMRRRQTGRLDALYTLLPLWLTDVGPVRISSQLPSPVLLLMLMFEYRIECSDGIQSPCDAMLCWCNGFISFETAGAGAGGCSLLFLQSIDIAFLLYTTHTHTYTLHTRLLLLGLSLGTNTKANTLGIT